jgi:hypothetical protein
MESKSLRERSIQELLERAAEFDAMAARARTTEAKTWMKSFAARFRTLAAWRATDGQSDEELSTAAPVEMPMHPSRRSARREHL